MKVRLIVLVVAFAAMLTFVSSPGAADVYKKTRWVQKWSHIDRSIWPSVHVAARRFSVSESLMRDIVNGEGGNVNPQKLRLSLCTATQPGWNTQGSYAFGPMQYMLGSKPACSRSWGTFGAYDDRAFREARRLGMNVPYRFKTPASNVGQSIVTAYIIRIGQVCVHWSASLGGC